MPKYFTIILLAIFLAFPAWTQEDEAAGQTADTAEEASDDETAADDTPADADEVTEAEEEIDDSDLDEQTYEEDDDDFVPTEEIPADEPIPFPSNI